LHPDGGRLGLETIDRATEEAIEGVASLLQSPDDVSKLVLGE
jgi:hypothetical protein